MELSQNLGSPCLILDFHLTPLQISFISEIGNVHFVSIGVVPGIRHSPMYTLSTRLGNKEEAAIKY